jgi:hypothetical protein
MSSTLQKLSALYASVDPAVSTVAQSLARRLLADKDLRAVCLANSDQFFSKNSENGDGITLATFQIMQHGLDGKPIWVLRAFFLCGTLLIFFFWQLHFRRLVTQFS